MLDKYDIFDKSITELNLVQNRIINTINPHSYCIAKKDLTFHNALLASDILLPDGIGIVLAEKLLNKKEIKKIAGYDLFLFFLENLNRNNGKCYFLGSSKSTLELIKNRIKIEYPNIALDYFSPPYKDSFSEKESIVFCEKINRFNPDVLFVGMTAPKQEKWVFQYESCLNTSKICCIGAVFDFYGGTKKRSSDIWINLGLEWLPRLIRDPIRLFYRNFISSPKFIIEVLSYKLFGRGVL